MYSPISGKVVEINSTLGDEPSLINSSPYEKGWIAKIQLSKPDELNALMDESSYQKHIAE